MRRTFPCPTVWRVVIPRAFVVALGLLALQRCAPARSAEPPLLLIVERDAWVYTPTGHFQVPAGTEIEMCPDPDAPPVPPPPILSYDIPAFALLVPFPCELRPRIFVDGFEG